MPYITLATEDELSESVGIRLINDFLPNFCVPQLLRQGGSGYLKSRCHNFNKMAERHPVFLITDLDSMACPSYLMQKWFGNSLINDGFLFRVAVREIEAWLLADHQGMQQLLERGANNLERNPDNLPNPKEYLLQCARRAPRDVKNDLIRQAGSLASQGLGYNSRLCAFVQDIWSPDRASGRSDSLARAIHRLRSIVQ